MLAILEREGDPCGECGRGGQARDSDVVGIFDKLAKYGVGERKTVSRDELGTIFGAMWDLVVMHNNIEDPTDRLTAIQNDWSSLSA